MNAIKTKTLKQSANFRATPHQIYEMLMDSKMHSAFTGEKANISRKVGGKFTAYGKYIEGKNKQLVKDKKIVQWWRGSDWPKGHYSVVTYKLTKKGSSTRLDFTQTGLPASQYSDIKQGWKDFYWEKIKAQLG
jgi:activator of HSP90 ATPase